MRQNACSIAGDGSDTGVTEQGKRPIEKVEGTDEGVESKKIKTSSDNQTTEVCFG